MDVALSPCPNDTFLFYPWIHGHLKEIPAPRPHFADIQELNEWAFQGAFPLIKISFASLKAVSKNYVLLPVGAAIGYGCGPKLISKYPFPLSELSSKIVAIPGKYTTAHLLFNKLLGECKQKIFCLYNEIENLLNTGICDCGIIIHESRFTYLSKGFYELVDLGTLWEHNTSLPLPLGGLVAKKELGGKKVQELTETLRLSLEYSWAHPEISRSFIQEHSQVKDLTIIQQHINLYVNRDTHTLSSQAKHAIEKLILI